jgi:hypothetical protein
MPSRAATAAMTSPISGSTDDQPSVAFATSSISSTPERYVHSRVCWDSATTLFGGAQHVALAGVADGSACSAGRASRALLRRIGPPARRSTRRGGGVGPAASGPSSQPPRAGAGEARTRRPMSATTGAALSSSWCRSSRWCSRRSSRPSCSPPFRAVACRGQQQDDVLDPTGSAWTSAGAVQQAPSPAIEVSVASRVVRPSSAAPASARTV